MISLRGLRSMSARLPFGLLRPLALAIAPTVGRWLFTKGPRRFIPFALLTTTLLLLYGLSFVWPGDPVSVLHDLGYFVIGIGATLFGTAGGLIGGALISVLLGPLSSNHLLNHTSLHLAVLSVQFVLWESFGFLAGAVVETVQAYFARTVEAESRLMHADKMEAIGRLTGGVAHDFNNMLATIGGYCELIRAKAERLGIDSFGRDFDEATAAIQRAGELTHQLLAISRRQVMVPRRLDLAEEIGAVSKMLQRLVGAQIQIETAIAPTEWPVSADPVQLIQVVMNLVVNARDAMPQGGTIDIEVAYVRVDRALAAQLTEIKPGDFATISVRDSGHGIDEEAMAHIFEPFFTTKAEGIGTGLGLSTSMGIIRQLGGDIWVYSEPGVGTTFKIFLPRATAEAPDSAANDMPAHESNDKRSATVLVVDDNRRVLQIVTDMLNSQGYTVLSAPDGRAALEALAAHDNEVSLVVTDVAMQGITGVSLAAFVRERYPRAKIILTSGYLRKTAEGRDPLRDSDGYLEKPFTAQAISELINRVLS